MLLKFKINYLKSKIKESNLNLLEDFSEYSLEKMLAWQNDYSDFVEWKEFDDHWFWCEICKSWQEGQCICYAR